MKPITRNPLPVGIALLALSTHCARPDLIHRWTFGEAAGPAPAGTTFLDSVGNADGFIRGDGAVFTGGGLDLPGGDSFNGLAAYADLPNGLISGLTDATFEGWVTVDAANGSWTRIFDFGSTQPGGAAGEITGPGNTNGGGTQGADYLILSASRGANYDQQRIEWRNEDPAGGGISTFDSDAVTTVGQPIHFVVTVTDLGNGSSEINYWRDGVQQTTGGVASSSLSDINDVNMWLGRSNWINDATLDGTFDEFRIYDNALTAQEVAENFAAGPNPKESTDTDNDGIPDAFENQTPFLDPGNPDDAGEDEDGDGLDNRSEFEAGTSLEEADTDGDGSNDGPEINNGTDPLDQDTDGDGLLDGVETNTGVFLSESDTGTDPLNPDSDNDLFRDGAEILAGSDPNDPGSQPATRGLIHRWSFDEAPGAASDGSIFADSVGGAHGIVRGDGAQFTGTGLDLPGGDSLNGRAAYGDLPNGLISVLTDATFEGWVTVDSASGGNWTRIFDFGSTQGNPVSGEITGPGNTNGGGTQGSDYIILSASRGGNYDQQRIEVRNEDPPGGGSNTFDSDVPTTFGQQFHFAVTVKNNMDGTAEINYWRDGIQQTTGAISNTTLDKINDVNNWVGRSTWLNDGTLDGTFDEFRIYDKALSPQEVANSFAFGPNLPDKNIVLTDVSFDATSATLSISWLSEPGKLYNLRSEVDPGASAPLEWPVFNGQRDIPATPPENTLAIPFPDDRTRFFAIEGFDAPPTVYFEDDLESGAPGWTTVVNDAFANTQWELGTPGGTTGPNSGANNSLRAWCTNLGDYGPDSDISLRSPAIDLTGAPTAILKFQVFRDADGEQDSGTVRFLRADDLTPLGESTDLELSVLDNDYGNFQLDVVPEALGQVVIIEWNFQSDASNDPFSGLAIDDIMVAD